MAALSDARATEARKLLLKAAILKLFEEYLGQGVDNVAAAGQLMTDATGVQRNVFVRFQNFILDYPVVAAWTLTLQNQTCFCRRRLAGQFHLLPHSPDVPFLPPLVAAVIKLEKCMHQFPQSAAASVTGYAAGPGAASPYLEPLLKFLNRHSMDAVKYFLAPERLNDKPHIGIFHALQ